MRISFQIDRIRIKTMADGGYQVILDTGENATEAVQQIVGLPRESIYNIEIYPDVSKI